MDISEKGIDLIKKWEGCKLEAYQDQKGIWTIGIGSIDNVVPDMKITLEEAIMRLKTHCSGMVIELNKYIKAPLNQNQFDAVCSLAYNIGVNAFRNSTCLKKINEKDFDGAAHAILMWDKIKVGGKMIYNQGLHNRRLDEQMLFLS